ncbi:MAG: PaREP1 family protein [Sulfolobales archaeon]
MGVLAVGDSAEKTWNAVAQAVNALVHKYMDRIPSSHFERRKMFREIKGKDKRVEELGILNRYITKYKVLHGETFYEGVVDIEQLKTEMEKVRKLIKGIKLLID